MPKDELVRLVREADGTVAIDARGTRPGRGAYVCGEATCIERGLRRERLAHAFRGPGRVTSNLAEDVAALVRARGAVAHVPVE
jgi:predicted RNA-binding protein YlxR (DUF448 family)